MGFSISLVLNPKPLVDPSSCQTRPVINLWQCPFTHCQQEDIVSPSGY